MRSKISSAPSRGFSGQRVISQVSDVTYSEALYCAERTSLAFFIIHPRRVNSEFSIHIVEHNSRPGFKIPLKEKSRRRRYRLELLSVEDLISSLRQFA